MKTKFIKAITLCLALLMCVTCAVPASAAEYKDATINVDAEKVQAWIKNGAQPTDTVRGLLKNAGVL